MLALLVMRRWQLLSDLPVVIHDKKGGGALGMRVVMYLGGDLAYVLFVRGSVLHFLRDVVRTYVSFLFFLFRYIIFLYIGLMTT